MYEQKLWINFIFLKMLAADIYESLTDVGFSNKNKIQDVGIRLIVCLLIHWIESKIWKLNFSFII